MAEVSEHRKFEACNSLTSVSAEIFYLWAQAAQRQLLFVTLFILVLNNAAKSVCRTATRKKPLSSSGATLTSCCHLLKQESCSRWEPVAKHCVALGEKSTTFLSEAKFTLGAALVYWCCICTADAMHTDIHFRKICKRILQLLTGSGCNKLWTPV